MTRLATILALLLCVGELPALERSGTLGPLTYRVLAPGWARQGETISVLLILQIGSQPPEDERPEACALDVALSLPDGVFLDRNAGVNRARLVVRRGKVFRFAFRQLELKKDAPRGVHQLHIGLRPAPGELSESDTKGISFDGSLAVLPGAAIPRGKWSVLIPAVIALLTTPLFLALFRKYGRPRWWKRLPEPYVPESAEMWWTKKS